MASLDEARFDFQLPTDRPFQLVGVGLNAVDWIVQVPSYPAHDSKMAIDAMHRLGGGQTATACALCARYGAATRYIGRVGSDDIGQFSRRDLEKEPMEVDLETVEGAASQYAVIIVDRETGERTILWHRDPALLYTEGELDRDKVVSGRILHLDGHDLQASIQAARWAHDAAMAVSLDIDRVQSGVEELLPLVDFLIPTTHFVTALTGNEDWREAVAEAQRISGGFVAVTRGRKGVAALWEGRLFDVAGFPVRAVDTTGAGDVFHGAFLYGVLQGWTVGACLRFSAAAAALACTRVGARAGIPPLDEVRRLVRPTGRA